MTKKFLIFFIFLKLFCIDAFSRDVDSIYLELNSINESIDSNEWMVKYNNYAEYNNIYRDINMIENEISKKNKYTPETLNLERKLQDLKKQEELLQNYKNGIYDEFINIEIFQKTPLINNPLLIPSGYSYIKNIKSEILNLENGFKSLNNLLLKLNRKLQILESFNNKIEINKTNEIIQDLSSIQKTIGVYIDTLRRNTNSSIQKVERQIEDEFLKLLSLIVITIIIIALSSLSKLVLNLVTKDDFNKNYMINKFINILAFSVIILNLLFAYIENVAYVVTIIGFISAGIAIAMKDWFMSFFGWIVIIGSGSIKPGDRIKIIKDNTIYIGDVLDISLLKITLYEDVTYNTYLNNRRAGRIIFIPNNLIFNTMIANYSHSGMQTVWDGIDIVITFDSNYKKALKLVHEIALKHSLNITNESKIQLNKLRLKYSIPSINLDPKVFNFIVPNGIKISVWFQSNSYKTLLLHSAISGEIIDAFNSQSDIEIAYPTTSIMMKDKYMGA